jgi:cyclophilin family peptidyl-prolyl cis-trans isomerase
VAQQILAHFDTTEGRFTARLYHDKAPKTVENFVGLAEGTREWKDPRSGVAQKTPLYNGVVFHRVIDGFNRHSVFGEVVEGLDVVKRIGRVKTDKGDRPVTPVVINSITIERVGA